ncbi:ABC transporter permease [Paenibacillus thermotolerans]|uniref:ABC transporter permease n=1 Tax=Paenibacillus thermotolerans TaxID=3027807 RepID=UPI0023682DDE|nr:MULTISPECIES: ABC-2 family transporter protein [unclassified Paenibacillus]
MSGWTRAPVAAVMRKYPAVAHITLRNQLAYLLDFLVRTVFLIIILYIFLQLWSAVFAGEKEPVIAGYTFSQIIWYLIISEAVTLAFPSLAFRIEEEVKGGDVAYRLTRPIGYVGFHYASYLGEVVLRLGVNLLVGGALGVLVFGPPSFGFGWSAFVLVAVGALTVNFLLNMIVALCAFWVEETQGIEFVYKKLLFTVGGMMMPLEMFPGWLQEVCRWLPFQAVLYFPARTVTNFHPGELGGMLAVQWGWSAALAVVVAYMYRKGVRKLNVNGG